MEFTAKPGKPAYPINAAMTFAVDVEKQILRFIAEVPVGQWLALGWGWHMFSIDMLLLQAYPDIRRSVTSDLWSTHNVTPVYDEFDNFFDVKIMPDPERPADVQLFYFSRLLETGDDKEDYVVELDKDINICFGINIKTPDFEANTDWGLFKIRYNSDGTVKLSPISTGHNRFVHHGSVMFGCWFFLGFLLLATKRYFKWYWLLMHIAHMIIGTFVFVVTFYMGFKVMEYFAFHIHPDYHQIMGVITLFI